MGKKALRMTIKHPRTDYKPDLAFAEVSLRATARDYAEAVNTTLERATVRHLIKAALEYARHFEAAKKLK